MNEYQVFGPVCAWTHVLALVIVLASPVIVRFLLKRLLGKAQRRAQYRRNWERLTSAPDARRAHTVR